MPPSDDFFQAIQETRWRFKLAFLHSNYPPAESFQMSRHLEIALHVSPDLGPPKGGRGSGRLVAARAPVPKAPVNKQCNFRFRKNEVRLPENRRVPPPPRHLVCPQK